MDRQKELLKHVTKQARGIEIGPYFSPLAPKREGYNCLSLDVFDTESVKRRARMDPTVPADKVDLIEPVDLVGSAVRIDALCRTRGEQGEFDYVVSSHNFEHLPNPIEFLQACGRLLKRGGALSMALPDKRACFDFYRPRTSLSAWIEAFYEGRERPSHAQSFDQDGTLAAYVHEDLSLISFLLGADIEKVAPARRLREAFDEWKRKRETGDDAYYDAHCWTFTPSSFRLLVTDLFFLGLSPFAVEEVTDTAQSEFFAHLRLVGYGAFAPAETAAHYAERERLLRAVALEEANVVASNLQSDIFDHVRERFRRTDANGAITLARALLLLLRKRDVALFKQYLAVSNSVFFDPRRYARLHCAAGDPATHYLLEGWRCGFDPGPFFSTSKYLALNPDVAARETNPLAHYEMFGRAEGRRPMLR